MGAFTLNVAQGKVVEEPNPDPEGTIITKGGLTLPSVQLFMLQSSEPASSAASWAALMSDSDVTAAQESGRTFTVQCVPVAIGTLSFYDRAVGQLYETTYCFTQWCHVSVFIQRHDLHEDRTHSSGMAAWHGYPSLL